MRIEQGGRFTVPGPLRVSIALAIVAISIAGCRRAAPPPPPLGFELRNAWVRATPDSGATAAAYVDLANGTPDTVVVSHFSSDDARVVELHESSIDAAGQSHMAMRDSIAVAPGQIVAMKPGGFHLMMIGTTRTFAPGEMIRIEMHLSNGTIVSTSAKARE